MVETTYHSSAEDLEELAAAVSLSQRGRGMVRYNSKLCRQCEACRDIWLGFSECLAFVSCRARCVGGGTMLP